VFRSFERLDYLDYNRATNEHRWRYKIVDDAWSAIGFATGRDRCIAIANCVIDTYRKFGHPIVPNLIAAFQWHCEQTGRNISHCLLLNANNPKFTPYEQDLTEQLKPTKSNTTGRHTMSTVFKLKHSNQNGTFSVCLNRPVSSEDMQQIALIAHNLLTDEAAQNGQESADDGMSKEQQETLLGHIRKQHALGEQPTERLNLGTYKEPDKGVRIRMVSFPSRRLEVVRALRELTGISMIGAKDIVYGNVVSPLFSLDMGHSIMKRFKELDVYATLVAPDMITGPIRTGT
jgi:ribosomal protein L7/L12